MSNENEFRETDISSLLEEDRDVIAGFKVRGTLSTAFKYKRLCKRDYFVDITKVQDAFGRIDVNTGAVPEDLDSIVLITMFYALVMTEDSTYTYDGFEAFLDEIPLQDIESIMVKTYLYIMSTVASAEKTAPKDHKPKKTAGKRKKSVSKES